MEKRDCRQDFCLQCLCLFCFVLHCFYRILYCRFIFQVLQSGIDHSPSSISNQFHTVYKSEVSETFHSFDLHVSEVSSSSILFACAFACCFFCTVFALHVPVCYCVFLLHVALVFLFPANSHNLFQIRRMALVPDESIETIEDLRMIYLTS